MVVTQHLKNCPICFNKKTGLVEGILVRGELDFNPDTERPCDNVRICLESGEGCEGEDVTRITVIPELVPGMTPPEIIPPEEPDTDDDVDLDD